MPAPAVRVLLVDDDPIVAAVLGLLLAEDPEVTLVHVACDVASARACSRDQAVDVVLLDHDLPGGTAADVLPHLRTTWPQARVVLHTGRPDAQARHQELQTDGVVVKGTDWPSLLRHLRPTGPVAGRR